MGGQAACSGGRQIKGVGDVFLYSQCCAQPDITCSTPFSVTPSTTPSTTPYVHPTANLCELLLNGAKGETVRGASLVENALSDMANRCLELNDTVFSRKERLRQPLSALGHITHQALSEVGERLESAKYYREQLYR